jgi:hypothetical protein
LHTGTASSKAEVRRLVAVEPKDELEARAAAVLRTVRLARRLALEGGMVGLAPEGMDVAERLGRPPQGAGSFIALLVEAGLPVLPVGVTEREGRLSVSFVRPFAPDIPSSRSELDRTVARQVMASIARQLPGNQGGLSLWRLRLW